MAQSRAAPVDNLKALCALATSLVGCDQLLVQSRNALFLEHNGIRVYGFGKLIVPINYFFPSMFYLLAR